MFLPFGPPTQTNRHFNSRIEGIDFTKPIPEAQIRDIVEAENR